MDRSLPGDDDAELDDNDSPIGDPNVNPDGTRKFPLDHGYKPKRSILVLTLAPLVVIASVGTVLLNVFRATLVAHHPALLLALSPTWVYMASASVHTWWFTYMVIILIRSVIFDPCYFLLGRWYGDAALRWLEKQSPTSTKWLRRIEAWFPRFGPVLIAFYPREIVMILAGASKMKLWQYLAYDAAGTLFVSALVYRAGQNFSSQITSINGFFGHYWWQITLITLVYAVIVSIRAQMKDAKKAKPSLNDMVDDLQAEDAQTSRQQNR